MEELIIRPTFNIGDFVWIAGIFLNDNDEKVKIKNITIDHDENAFVYYFGNNGKFYDKHIGDCVFKSLADLDKYYRETFGDD